MGQSRGRKQVRLVVYENEPLARLAEQRLKGESIPCVVRSLGVGPGGWGVATNLPHAVYVKATDEMGARQVLNLAPGEIAERDGAPTSKGQPLPVTIVVILMIAAAALIFGMVELLARWMFR